MNDEFIPYAEALELKRLGFDEVCMAYYELFYETLIIFHNTLPMSDVEKKRPSMYRGDIKNSSGPQWLIATPTWKSAFKWFMDKHELYGSVINVFAGSRYYIEDKNKNYHNDLEFIEPEKAELECLKELIKIVKIKKV